MVPAMTPTETYGTCRVVIKRGSRCQPRTNPTADNLRKGLKQSFGMDKTGPNPPTRRDHLIPPVPRAKQLPPADTNTNQKGCLVCNKKKPSSSAAERRASKQTSSKQHRASKASKSSAPQPNTRPTSRRKNTAPRTAAARTRGRCRSATCPFPDEMAGEGCRVKSLSQMPHWAQA